MKRTLLTRKRGSFGDSGTNDQIPVDRDVDRSWVNRVSMQLLTDIYLYPGDSNIQSNSSTNVL